MSSYGDGNNTIDWLIRSEPVPVLLKVRNRSKDLIESLDRFRLGKRDPDETALLQPTMPRYFSVASRPSSNGVVLMKSFKPFGS